MLRLCNHSVVCCPPSVVLNERQPRQASLGSFSAAIRSSKERPATSKDFWIVPSRSGFGRLPRNGRPPLNRSGGESSFCSAPRDCTYRVHVQLAAVKRFGEAIVGLFFETHRAAAEMLASCAAMPDEARKSLAPAMFMLVLSAAYASSSMADGPFFARATLPGSRRVADERIWFVF